MSVEQDHEQRETISVDVIVPGHPARGAATALFKRTRLQLIEREHGRCWISGETLESSGAPLEAHHHPVERCFAERWDWLRFSNDCKLGMWGPYAQAFDWSSFLAGSTVVPVAATDDTPAYTYIRVADPYLFVDNMLVNGMLLAKKFHTGPDEGIHNLPGPIHLAQKYIAEGYRFSKTEVIHHDQ